MRPRSAGSSRISKWLLPLRAEAAISSASPLTGTSPLLAAATLSAAAGAAVVGGTGRAGCTTVVVWLLASVESFGWAVGANTEWSWTGAESIDGDALVAPASDLVRSELSLPDSGLTAAGCSAFGRAANVSVPVGERSEAAVLPSDVFAVAFADAAAAALGSVAFVVAAGITAAAANAASIAGVASVCVAACGMGRAVLWPAASTTAAASMTAAFSGPAAEAAPTAGMTGAASEVTMLGIAEAVASTASETILLCSCGGEIDAGAAEAPVATLATAATNASGAVLLAFEGEAAGTSASASGTAMATAIAAGIVTEAASCGVEAAGSADEAVPADALSLCCGLLSLDEPDFIGVRRAAAVFFSVAPDAPASEVCLTSGPPSSAMPVGLWSSEASRERPVETPCDRSLSLVDAAPSSARRCDADVCRAAELGAWLSGGRLESSSAPKSPFCAERSGRAVFGCAA